MINLELRYPLSVWAETAPEVEMAPEPALSDAAVSDPVMVAFPVMLAFPETSASPEALTSAQEMFPVVWISPALNAPSSEKSSSTVNSSKSPTCDVQTSVRSRFAASPFFSL